jgi:mono/diheme cytochrome c family protein
MHKLNTSKLLQCCAAAIVVLAVAACGGGDKDDEQRPVTPLVVTTGVSGGALGKLAYNNYCVQCHGVGAKSAATVAANTLSAIGSVGAMRNLSGYVTQADASAMAIYLANPAGF